MVNVSNVLLAAIFVLVPLIVLNAEVIIHLTLTLIVVMNFLNVQKENIQIAMEYARIALQTALNV